MMLKVARLRNPPNRILGYLKTVFRVKSIAKRTRKR